MNFGTYLEETLIKKNIKKIEFAKTLKISRQSLSTNIYKWKNGREPNIKTIKKYITALKLDLKDFTTFL